ALAAAAAGASVLWVRNAVDDAIQAAETLRAETDRIDLFHARFAMSDRRRIEDAVVARFGKFGPEKERRGRILVSTQVCESSLDLDLDLLISDLAPVDALIQRAGRIWRHMDRRPPNARPLDAPRLLLLAPDPGKVEGPAWVHEIQEKGGYVYPDAGVLWRTARVLEDVGEIRAPEGVRRLIEEVYADGAETPQPLQAAATKAEGARLAEEQLAKLNTLNLTQGYGAAGAVHDDQEIGTRLGRPTVTLRLARRRGDQITPWAEVAEDRRRAWAMSEISVPKHWIEAADARLSPPADLADAIAAATADWPAWERQTIRVAAVEPGGAVALKESGGGLPLTYASDRGLIKSSPHLQG
ncbi:MAG: CRISPR-associated helicase/endonuclease Cas3, partial [Pseudomonadota bacterium]